MFRGVAAFYAIVLGLGAAALVILAFSHVTEPQAQEPGIDPCRLLWDVHATLLLVEQTQLELSAHATFHAGVSDPDRASLEATRTDTDKLRLRVEDDMKRACPGREKG